MKFFVDIISHKEVQIRMLFKVFNKVSGSKDFFKTMTMENKEAVAKWFEETIDKYCPYDIHSFYVKPLSVESDKLMIEYRISTSDFNLENLQEIHLHLLNPDKENKHPYQQNGQYYQIVGATI